MQNFYEQCHQKLPQRVKEWLNKRGIKDEIISRFFIGWDKDKITIPIFDENGTWLFFKYRKDPDERNERESKYWSSLGGMAVLYGIENLKKKINRIVICEGELDRLTLESKEFPAVTSTGGVNTFKKEWTKYFKEIPEVFVCFDRDEAGMKGAERVVKLIPHVKIIQLPEMEEGKKDVTDYFMLGKNIEEFKELMKNAKTSNEFIKERGEVKKRMEDEERILEKVTSAPIELIPAQDFRNGTAYVTVVVTKIEKGEVKEIPLLITSNKEYFL